jgi:integrase
MRDSKRLTAVAVAKQTRPGRYGDGGGLWLQVSSSGTKAWLFRYMLHGKARQMGLGPVHTITLAMARDKALECRRLLLEGIDPIEKRRAGRDEALIASAKGITFKECAERYIAAHEPGWRNSKHASQWKATLATYAYPLFGSLPVAAVDIGLILKALEPIWSTRAETAGRVRGRIESVLDWATARGYRKGENPARWRGHLDKLLPSRRKVAKVKHHAALPYSELPGFLTPLRSQEGIAARALEFTILTAARTGETIGATWAEIDLVGQVWTVPADRIKGGRAHRVPLSGRAIRILAEVPREGDYVFPGGKKGKPLSNMALLQTLRRMKRDDLTSHGFRSTFRDWAAETTAYPNEVVEMALAHVIESKAEAAYRRGDLFEKRRRLMADWAMYCEAPAKRIEVAIREMVNG